MSFQMQQMVNIAFKSSSSEPSLDLPRILFNFDNSGSNAGTLGGQLAFTTSSNYSYSNAQFKQGTHSLDVIGATANISGYVGYNNYRWPVTNGLTISFWVRFKNSNITQNGGYPVIFFHNGLGAIGNNGRIGLFISPSTNIFANMLFVFGSNGTSELIYSMSRATYTASPYNVNLTDTAWNHFGWSINSNGNWTIVINGANIAGLNVRTTNMAAVGSATESPIVFGQEGATNIYPKWNGYIDCFRVYNRNLSVAEIQNLYTSGI
jgi:hypothetical protein